MPVLTVYHGGLKMGCAPFPEKNMHQRAKRGEVAGWTAGASRRNTAFLQSVRPADLTGYGWAVTLTLRHCPPAAADWGGLVESWLDRIRKMRGFIRLHWVVEWQARGVPHLHACVYFEEPDRPRQVLAAWLDLSRDYGSMPSGQHMAAITSTGGWLRYLAKHAARGQKHYQRQRHQLPSGWTTTGRLWGKRGKWPVSQALRLQIDDRAFYRLRRVVRGLYRAHARAVGSAGLIVAARRYLRCTYKPASRVRGCAAWADGSQVVDVLHQIIADQRGSLLPELVQWTDARPDLVDSSWLMFQRLLEDDPFFSTRGGDPETETPQRHPRDIPETETPQR